MVSLLPMAQGWEQSRALIPAPSPASYLGAHGWHCISVIPRERSTVDLQAFIFYLFGGQLSFAWVRNAIGIQYFKDPLTVGLSQWNTQQGMA